MCREAGFCCICHACAHLLRVGFRTYALTTTWLMRARLTTWVRFSAGWPSLLLTLCEWQPRVTLQTLAVCRQCMIGLRDGRWQDTHTHIRRNAHRSGVNILLGTSDSQQNCCFNGWLTESEIALRCLSVRWIIHPKDPSGCNPPLPALLTLLPLPTALPLTLLFSSFFLLLPP